MSIAGVGNKPDSDALSPLVSAAPEDDQEMKTIGDIRELAAWLEADDAKGRTRRAERLRDLLDILPVHSEGLSLRGGESSRLCFEEVRRCYLDGSNMAVVLLCLAYVEREFAADLYAAGWDYAEKAPLQKVLKKAYKAGVLSRADWELYRQLGRLRNSHAHFRAPPDKTSMMARTVKERSLSTALLAKDARRAIQAMARTVKRQSGGRVALGTTG